MIKTKTAVWVFFAGVLLFLSQVNAQYPVKCPTPEPGKPPVLIPNPLDCTQYFICDGLTPILMQCPFPLVFDPNINACQSPGLYQCIVTTDPPTTTTPAPTTTQPTTLAPVTEDVTTTEELP